MAYFDLASLAQDWDFTQRIAAVATDEIDLVDEHPLTWAQANQWTIASAPGFSDAYASAVAGEVPNPGRDPSVITDGQLLAAVQALFPDEPDEA